MDKIYSRISLPDDILSKIRDLNTEDAISTLKSILEHDEYILLPRRIEMFQELTPDKARAESLAVLTCKGSSFKIRDDPNITKSEAIPEKTRSETGDIPKYKTTNSTEFNDYTVKYKKTNTTEVETMFSKFNGKAVSCAIERNGDLIHKVYLEVKLPEQQPRLGSNYSIGHNLIQDISIEIGGVPYETTYFKGGKEIKYRHGGTLPEMDAIEIAKFKLKALVESKFV